MESGKITQFMYMLLIFSDPQIRTDNVTVTFFQICEILFMKIYKDTIKQEHATHYPHHEDSWKKFLPDLSIRNGCVSPEQLGTDLNFSLAANEFSINTGSNSSKYIKSTAYIVW